MSSNPGAGRHSLATREAYRPAGRATAFRRPGVKAGLLATGAIASVLAAVTACSAVQSTPTPVADTSAIGGAPAQATGGAPALTGPNLKVSQVAAGTVVTNDGFTVYRFEKDTAKPPKTNCAGSCAQAWPPVLATDTPWLKGVPSDKVGTVSRPDGSKQLTLGGWPLYRYAKDTSPGDTKGQGVGGTWCAVGPDGKPAKIAGAPAAAPSGSGSSGYGASQGSSSSSYGSAGSGGSSTATQAPASGSGSGYSSGSGY